VRRGDLPFPPVAPFRVCLSVCLSVCPSIDRACDQFLTCAAAARPSSRYRSRGTKKGGGVGRGGGGGGWGREIGEHSVQNCNCAAGFMSGVTPDRQSILDRHFADGEVLAGQEREGGGGEREREREELGERGRLWYRSAPNLFPRFFVSSFYCARIVKLFTRVWGSDSAASCNLPCLYFPL